MNSRSDRSITEAFLTAGRELGIEVVAPFVLIVDGRRHEFPAFVPHFGCSKGIAVAPMPSDPTLSQAAQRADLGTSFVNPELYSSYGREHFIDMLTEWGFYGPAKKRPSWLDQSW